jgi:hypothetical protein
MEKVVDQPMDTVNTDEWQDPMAANTAPELAAPTQRLDKPAGRRPSTAKPHKVVNVSDTATGKIQTDWQRNSSAHNCVVETIGSEQRLHLQNLNLAQDLDSSHQSAPRGKPENFTSSKSVIVEAIRGRVPFRSAKRPAFNLAQLPVTAVTLAVPLDFDQLVLAMEQLQTSQLDHSPAFQVAEQDLEK